MNFRNITPPNIYGVMLLLTLFMFLQGCDSKETKMAGSLLVPMSTDLKTNVGIYKIDLNRDQKMNVYFRNEALKYVRFPMKKGKSLYLLAQTPEDYAILEIKDNRVLEIYKSNLQILNYAMGPSGVVFTRMENGKAHLYYKSLGKSEIIKIYNGEVDEKSKPIIKTDGSIIFVSKCNKTYKIWNVNNNGGTALLAMGRFPLLINKEEDMIFYTFRSLKKLNISDKAISEIKCKVALQESPVLSPDGKYIAFYETDYVSAIFGEWTDFLSVMSLKNNKKIHINQYNKARITLTVSGIDWIE